MVDWRRPDCVMNSALSGLQHEADIGCLEVLGQCVDPNPLPEGMEKLGPEIFDMACPVALVLRMYLIR